MREAGLGQQCRQLHAASFETARGIKKTRFQECVHRRFDFRNQDGLAVLVARFVFVVLAVMWREVLLGNVSGGTDGRVEGFAIVFGKPLALGQALGIEDFVQLESQIAGTE